MLSKPNKTVLNTVATPAGSITLMQANHCVVQGKWWLTYAGNKSLVFEF